MSVLDKLIAHGIGGGMGKSKPFYLTDIEPVYEHNEYHADQKLILNIDAVLNQFVADEVNGFIYGFGNNAVYKFNFDGFLIWSVVLPFTAAPTNQNSYVKLLGDTLLINTPDGTSYMKTLTIDTFDGSILGQISSTAPIDVLYNNDGYIYAITNTNIIKFNRDLSTVYSVKLGSGSLVSIAFGNYNQIVVCNATSSFFLVDKATGTFNTFTRISDNSRIVCDNERDLIYFVSLGGLQIYNQLTGVLVSNHNSYFNDADMYVPFSIAGYTMRLKYFDKSKVALITDLTNNRAGHFYTSLDNTKDDFLKPGGFTRGLANFIPFNYNGVKVNFSDVQHICTFYGDVHYYDFYVISSGADSSIASKSFIIATPYSDFEYKKFSVAPYYNSTSLAQNSDFYYRLTYTNSSTMKVEKLDHDFNVLKFVESTVPSTNTGGTARNYYLFCNDSYVIARTFNGTDAYLLDLELNLLHQFSAYKDSDIVMLDDGFVCLIDANTLVKYKYSDLSEIWRTTTFGAVTNGCLPLCGNVIAYYASSNVYQINIGDGSHGATISSVGTGIYLRGLSDTEVLVFGDAKFIHVNLLARTFYSYSNPISSQKGSNISLTYDDVIKVSDDIILATGKESTFSGRNHVKLVLIRDKGKFSRLGGFQVDYISGTSSLIRTPVTQEMVNGDIVLIYSFSDAIRRIKLKRKTTITKFKGYKLK